MITITLQQIEAHNPCTSGWTKVLRANGGVSADRTQPFALASVLDSNDLADTLWCLKCLPEYDAVWRLYAVWCARQVQHLMVDQRSIRALDVATDYALGQATSTELAAAADIAYTYADTYAAAAADIAYTYANTTYAYTTTAASAAADAAATAARTNAATRTNAAAAARANAAYAYANAADAATLTGADAARAATRKKQADMIRRVLNADDPLDEIKAALDV